MIPKIIHQIWYQGENNIPEKYQINIQSIKNNHKDWQYIFWDDNSIKPNLSSIELELYNNYQYMHQKIDFAKYVILNQMGGVYLDMDVKSLKPLDNLIDENQNKELIISKTNTNYFESIISCLNLECYNNGIIISSPNNKILKEIIDYCLKIKNCSSLLPKINCINITTGPQMFTKIINKFKNDKILILDNEYLEPCTYTNCKITDKTLTKHEHEFSWVNSNIIKILDFYLNNKILFCLLIFALLFIIYKLYNVIKNNIIKNHLKV
jgi:mannosyltransferase OCH1-like enzyme